MTSAYFLSTTIPYVNARPHLGHAFEFVQADAYARFRRWQGRDVYLLTGSDENSLKNVLAAEKEGISARELVDRNVVYFQELVAALQVSNDGFIRTSVDPLHAEGARRIWELMAEQGDIYKKEYGGLYCVGCEQFYTPAELVDGKCPEHLVEPEWVSEENYFFRLSRYQQPLLDAIESGRLRIRPESRRNEVVSFLHAGLADISVSRSVERAHGWGIPVPGDDSQVMYVWIDALTNYVTALGWARDDPRYQRYWANAADRVHDLGKGVIRFHAVYWPAMLLSVGLPLPTELVVHGYVTSAGQKLSKSLGNSTDPRDVADRYGVEALRYFLLADVSPFQDSDFSEERLVARYNTDLANGLGNLVSRTTSMVGRYRQGVVPAAAKTSEVEAELATQVEASAQGVVEAMGRYDHRDALARVWELVRRTNLYLDENAPWHLAKAAEAGDRAAAARLDTTLHHAAASVRQLGVLLQPFLPAAAEAVLAAVGSAGDPQAPRESRRGAPVSRIPPADAWLDGMADTKVAKPAALFPRLDPAPSRSGTGDG